MKASWDAGNRVRMRKVREQNDRMKFRERRDKKGQKGRGQKGKK